VIAWIAASVSGLGLGLAIAILVWQLSRARAQRDAADAMAADAENANENTGKAAAETTGRQEGVNDVLRSQRDEAHRAMAALSPRAALRAGLSAAAAAVGEAGADPHAEVSPDAPAAVPPGKDRGRAP
jgi:Flp pilus assembly protein TadB